MYCPADKQATKVSALAIDEDATPALLAAAVRELLAERFDPTFDDEPEWLTALERALEIVKADLRASGLPDAVRLWTWEGSSNVGVDAWAGNSTSGGIFPQEGKDPVTAMAAVADDAQDAVMHSICAAWPTCPVHRRGGHVRVHDGAVVWWCQADGGHAIARVGQLAP